ncbi:MAG: alkaline phosphatase family protein, partial [Verrucomicrobiae bacterium]|nr:alkaline phosphatase family protein [Verrucomicrobiae bacterium]
MISRLHVRMRWLRRKLSRTHLAARFLGIRMPAGEAEESGLILIQLDGLSRKQFDRALSGRRLPFLSRMVRRGHFRAEDFYSGVPSTTPAVQAEIFYQEKTAVPAFQFLERGTGSVRKMYEADSARAVEERLGRGPSEPLLKGGHSYSNIYTAGAAESRYCSQDLAVDTLVQRLHPFKTLLLCLTHSVRILRIIGLALVEVVLAFVDLVKGLYEKGEFWKELSFVPARITICILVREAIRFRALLDIERGVRVIHANFLGYDEQAHRRGPSSAFAHWTLKGIDRAIRDIHRAAMRSPYREYEMIVYSDHGQEETTPYERIHGRLLEDALGEVFSHGPAAEHPVWSTRVPSPVGGTLERWMSMLKLDAPSPRQEPDHNIVLTAMGPLAHVYLPMPLDEARTRKYALELVRTASVPLVVLPARGGEAAAFNSRGEWSLPRDAGEVLGGNHPFASEIANDMVALAAHPDSGDFILSGWSPREPPVTFPLENGGHGGPGREETHGFILLPERIDRWHHEDGPDRDKVLRGTRLHRIVRHFLHEDPVMTGGLATNDGGAPSLRVATYNVHGCVGLDGRMRPDRIARVVNSLRPDVIALQEVDVHRPRSRKLDQPHEIGRRLDMEHVFHSMLEEHDERYGIAILSRHPLELVRKG